MALITEKAQAVLVKIETTSGTDAVPTGANVVRTKGVPEVVVDVMDPGDRGDVQTGIDSAADDAAAVGLYMTIDLVLEMKGLLTAYSSSNRPEADALLRGSKMSATIDTTVGAELARYTTIDVVAETFTIYVYAAGMLFKGVGGIANVKGAADLYKTGTLTFSVRAKMTALPTNAAVPSLTFLQVVPEGFHSALSSLTGPLGAWASNDATDPLMLQSAAFDLGNQLTDVGGAGATDGLAAFTIPSRAPTQDLSMYTAPLSKMDMFLAAQSDGFAWSLTSKWQVGHSLYNRVKVETRWKARMPRLSSKNGIKVYTASGPLRVGPGLSTGRELILTFY